MCRPRASVSRGRADLQGSAIIEMAVVLPVLLLLVFGMIQYGLILTTGASLRDVAAQAARDAAVRGSTTNPAIKTNAINYAAKYGITLTAADVVLTATTAPVFYTAEVTYDFPLVLKYIIPGGGPTMPLRATATFQ